MKFLILTIILMMSGVATAANSHLGMNLTEIDSYFYDANPGGAKTPAQVAVDELKALGFTHIILNPRAKMTDPRGNEVIPMTDAGSRAQERQRYKRLCDYIHSLGMTVGIRPIFFVVRPDGSFPYIEPQPDGTQKIWWHGNIQPSDPNRWFESFKTYLDIYLLISRFVKADEFTLGAELYSMTVGIEDQWLQYPYGFPGKWLDILNYARAKLGPGVRIMYDINFTDDKNNSGGLSTVGGEFERWRYRLVDLANRPDPAERKIWQDLVDFWKQLDAVGIDMYRSLASPKDEVPEDYNALLSLLKVRSDAYAAQMDTALFEIQTITGQVAKIYFKEVGYRSMEKGFIDPFNYASPHGGRLNIQHQAAAFEAFYQSFQVPGFEWYMGVNWWDVSVDPRRKGADDSGFSPLGKQFTEDVIRRYR